MQWQPREGGAGARQQREEQSGAEHFCACEFARMSGLATRALQIFLVIHRHPASKQRAARPLARSGAFRKNGLLLKRAMERFSLELEATEVFYGKNQSCRACRETHRTGGN